ncbi:MAG: cold-shock protein [Thermoplasmatota archaeon]
MANGTIVKFVDDKGFGFIKMDGEDKEIFFHHSAFAGEPQEGMSVTFETEASDRGPRATNVAPA